MNFGEERGKRERERERERERCVYFWKEGKKRKSREGARGIEGKERYFNCVYFFSVLFISTLFKRTTKPNR